MAWTGPKILALSPLPPNICKPLLVSPFPPPVVTTSALSIEVSKKKPVARRKIRNAEHYHQSWCARSERKQVSRVKGNRTIIGKRPTGRFSGTSLLRRSASVYFSRTLYTCELKKKETRMLAIISSIVNRARMTFSNLFLSLSRLFMRLYPLVLFSPRSRLLYLSQFLALSLSNIH